MVAWKSKLENFIDTNLVPLLSATSAVEVGVGVDALLEVQTVYVVPGVAHVALDPLHRVLLGQPAPRRRARLHRPTGHLLVLVVRGGRGGAGGGGGGRRGGGRGRRGGWRGQGGPGRGGVFSGAASPLAARRKETIERKERGGGGSVRSGGNKRSSYCLKDIWVFTQLLPQIHLF